MAQVIKVKPKKNYDWNQDTKFLYIRIPMPSHTSIKKIEIFLSDLILRVTSLQRKNTHFLDLNRQIDYLSAQNKFVLTDQCIHATLKKKIPQKWQRLLVEDISLAELKVRRRQSEARYEQHSQQIEQTKQKLKTQYDRKATQELMRFEEEQRKQLENKKKQEKEQAIKQIFTNVNENTGKISTVHEGGKIEYEEQKWKQKERVALELIKKEEQEQIKNQQNLRKAENEKKLISQVEKQTKQNISGKQIFGEEDVQKFDKIREQLGEPEVQYEQIPVRKANTVKVNFTERIFPHLAARDTHYKEAPMPKNKKAQKSLQGTQVEETNPLWLKDKGDKFLKEKNYQAAIEAYNSVLVLDSKMLSAYSNRSLAYLRSFNYEGAISDSQQCLFLMQGQLGAGEEDAKKSLNLMIKLMVRKAIAKAWKGQLLTAKKELETILADHAENLLQQQSNEIKKALGLIQKRQQSLRYKAKGDQQVKLTNFAEAISHYNQSLKIDYNQYSISNKALCLNKSQQYDEAVEVINTGIAHISKFNLVHMSSPNGNNRSPQNLLLKLYYRKAKALKEMGKVKQAQETIHKGLVIDSGQQDFQQLLKEINKEKNMQIVKQQKEDAAALIKQANFKGALEIYVKCLKMIDSPAENLSEYLGVLQNQCVCYLKLNDYQSIISTAIRIMKIISNYQNKIVEFGDKKKVKSLSQEQVRKISVRTLMRRANAYLKKQQIYNAKADLEKAAQLDPNDETIKRELEKVKAQLGL